MTTGNGPATMEVLPLPRDLRTAAKTLGPAEVRYLVDSYYQLQEFRKGTRNQARALAEAEEPHATVGHFAAQFEAVERQLRSALDAWSAADELASWAREQKGIGPVIAAGLRAHIDVERARTAGAVWRFAGLDPTLEWGKGQKRPYNASLKVLAWKIGDSFVKLSGDESCFYGQLYVQRKLFEVERNENGGNAEAAKATLAKHPSHKQRDVYESGKLPDGRLDLRARRWAVKLFLAHYWERGRELAGLEIVSPYPIAHMDHVHKIERPQP